MRDNKNDSKYLWGFLVFLLGSISSQLLYHFRFNNDLLRREMLLLMRESNSGYFLSFIMLDIILILLVLSLIFIIKRQNRRIDKVK